MASLFSSRCLWKHPRFLSPLRTLQRPPAACLPASSRPLLLTLSPLRFSSTATRTAFPPGLPSIFSQIPTAFLDHDTPLTLAGADDMDLPQPKVQIDYGKPGHAVTSLSDSSKTYYCERHSENSYSCNCPAWGFQKKPIDVRSCKHLRQVLGDEHEDARCGASGRPGSKSKSGTTTAAKRGKKAAAAPPPEPEPERTYAAEGSKKRGVIAPGKGAKAKRAKRDAEMAAEEAEAEKEREREAEATQVGKVTDPDEAVESGGEEQGGADLLLANKWEEKKDPTGWWMSEKLDGVRAYWDGQSKIWSRTRKRFLAPPDFIAKLPRGTTLDGELFLGRNRFDETSGIVRSMNSPRWNELRFMVFDIPSMADSPFETRQRALSDLFPSAPRETATASSAAALNPLAEHADAGAAENEMEGEGVVRVVEQEVCEGREHLVRRAEEVRKLGGEGLMLRQPASRYIPKRSSTLLKVKSFHDAEARVVGHEKGRGKYSEVTGALVCEMESGMRFSVGSGLTDERRGRPPPIGSIITYRFQELTKQGVPRFPTFVGERNDVEGPKDAVID
ncbi:hypothetical protein JCM8097_001910 [Rhodosporidiobolus ruineniae]